ncbi:MAG: hypothetical protein Q9208_002167 [Pyrenodesmia sp. 3 TL-2023]
MSQYFNSFFDPVVRQARRFSRHGDDQEDASHPQPPERLSDGDSFVAVRSDIVSSNDTVSSNPVYGVPESLRSTTSSLSTSARTAADTTSHAGPDSARATRRNSGEIERRNTDAREGSLPADDGMGLMRKRIVAIQRTNSSSAEKARMVHDLMTEQYNSSQSSLQAPHPFRGRSPASLVSQERPFTPASLHLVENNSIHCISPPTPLSSVAEARDPFNLTLEDLKPTFYLKPTPGPANPEARNRSCERLSDEAGEDAKAFGCPHYKRNIKLQCSACYRWYTCRFCHDEVEDHSLNRPSLVVLPVSGHIDTLRGASLAQEVQSRPRGLIDGSRLVVMDGEAMGVDSDEEYSDRNFFGLESPRQGEPLVLAGSVSSGSEDVDESDEDGSQDDTDDQDEEDDMEIFGHR